MKRLLAVVFLFITSLSYAQGYKFEPVVDLEATDIKSQDHTGTCWSFSTTSFLESELLRMKKGRFDLSEMYNVRMVYPDKAMSYVRYHGKTQFGEGGLAHDVINTVNRYGVMPESVYSGRTAEKASYDHSEMVKMLEASLDVVLKGKTVSRTWMTAYNAILDGYMGAVPNSFKHDGKSYTPREFAQWLGLNSNDYVSITSFSHHPFYERFILEVPDNYSNGSFYNVPLNEFVAILDNALDKGFTVCWDADVSEHTFSAKNGVAIWPETAYSDMSADQRNELFDKIIPEANVTQELRQEAFEEHTTTDDHLMHITGRVKDQEGNVYYKVKNSWGTKAGKDGYMYVSDDYFKMKSISILLHKDGVQNDIRKKLNF